MNELQQKLRGEIPRLTNATFQHDLRVSSGQFSAAYFIKTARLTDKYAPKRRVLMQFFQKKQAVLCGIDEAISLIHTYARSPETLVIRALNDGDNISPYETVLSIEGEYAQFGFLEGLIDGILARRTSVATNVSGVVAAAGEKSVIFMGDRDDHFSQQPGDGYAAYIGGVTSQATDAMGQWWGGKGMGTMPHALIQAFEGDLVAACKAYRTEFPNDNLVALVDYHNDVIGSSLEVARACGKELYGVRLDTSQYMVDQYFLDDSLRLGQHDPRGVNIQLVQALRERLDAEGFTHVKIIVSGGFTAEKIAAFERENTPVDAYGVGSSLIKVTNGFSGDCVLLDGEPEAKVGRVFRPNELLELVTLPTGEQS